jgi:hypothetical protein
VADGAILLEHLRAGNRAGRLDLDFLDLISLGSGEAEYGNQRPAKYEQIANGPDHLRKPPCGISNLLPSDVSQYPESGRRELKRTVTPFRVNCQQELERL